jgi:2-polyprenyl-3-methyl-5-hydroxy-6-metoxy-1,4-benzoquinol methylase
MRFSNEYDVWHRKIFDSAPQHHDDSSPWHRIVLEYIAPVAGKHILEIACGRGGFASLLASKGAAVFGADFSNVALNIAHQKAIGDETLRIAFAQADAQQLPFPDKSFDIVVSCETIEHLPDPLQGLKEMSRVCRKGGLLYLTTPNYFNAMGLYFLYAKLRGRKATPGEDQPYDRVFWFPQIRRMLRRAGWRILRSDGTVHQLPIFPGHDPVAVTWVEKSRRVRRMLSPFAFHYFVLAQKKQVH